MGLRELKKQRTRKAISDLATQLFVSRGYYNVTTAEIAQLAEVSVPTLFKYFPTKESLVFDEDSEIEQWLVDSVKKRRKGQSILDALLEAGMQRISDIPASYKEQAKIFFSMIDETPELSRYANQMWMRHEMALSLALRKEAKNKLSTIESESIARFVLDSFNKSVRTGNPKGTLREVFQILKKGWDGQ